MEKTCFVIMGYGVKNNINLDLTYNMIIKPCIIENRLKPYPLYREEKYNAYRCDEIGGSIAIDYKFVTCLNGADIVIADISTMNVNAIYELGARHALKPRSTILLCTKDKKKEFKFFDITYVPIIFYDHAGKTILPDEIQNVKCKLNNFLEFAIESTSVEPDNPIHRALNEGKQYRGDFHPQENIYRLYTNGKEALDRGDFNSASEIFEELFSKEPSEENLLSLALAKYKKAEKANSLRGLVDCLNLIEKNANIDCSTSESLLGRLAAISLRIFSLGGNNEYYYKSLNYYRLGSVYSSLNLYCPRNYCALLFRIYEITEDINVIREYFYTAIHFAKLFLNEKTTASSSGNFEERIYLEYNQKDLKAIITGKYDNFDQLCQKLQRNPDITVLQKDTILNGVNKLREDIEKMYALVKPTWN